MITARFRGTSWCSIVEQALRKARNLWPRKSLPGDYNPLRPVASAVVEPWKNVPYRLEIGAAALPVTTTISAAMFRRRTCFDPYRAGRPVCRAVRPAVSGNI